MTGGFQFNETSLPGLITVTRAASHDSRGEFGRIYCDETFKAIGFNQGIRQINHSITTHRGTVRGLHFQHPPSREAKLVSCLRGKIMDIVVDIREGSATFLQWHAVTLSEESPTSVYIPTGFAHGFQSLTGNCHVLYLHTDLHRPELEGALNVQDPALAIDWPLEIGQMSIRDQQHPFLEPGYTGVRVS